MDSFEQFELKLNNILKDFIKKDEYLVDKGKFLSVNILYKQMPNLFHDQSLK